MCIVTIFFRQDGDHDVHGELAGSRQGHHLKTDISVWQLPSTHRVHYSWMNP
jgi:hypothetical protein